MNRSKILSFKLIFGLFLVVLFCEFLIYYIAVGQCSWPTLKKERVDLSIEINEEEKTEAIKAMFLADIHFQCSKKGGFGRLRSEWQMYRAFQTAVTLLKPELIFVLGDIIDGGLKCNDYDFRYNVKKLKSMFYVTQNTSIYFVAGNRDIGFHYDVTPHLHKRFSAAFKSPAVQLISFKGNHFVLINSMAMEGDGCFICRPAQVELNKISNILKCAKGIGKCFFKTKIKQFSRPIVVQHFPMYRDSDKHCSEPDEAPEDIKKQRFQERWNCLSKESSEMVVCFWCEMTKKIYDVLNPRVILGGHTHHGCHVVHRQDIHEYTLSSMNWKNKNNPSFVLAIFSPNNYSAKKCYLPQESTVIFFYSLGFIFVLLYTVLRFKSRPANLYLFRKQLDRC